MAKKTVNTEKIEEAVIIEETVNPIELTETIGSNLPTIPDVFFIDGEEFSVAKVEEMKAEAEALLKKATPETYSSTVIWEELKTLKNKLVKMRTTPDNKRKELTRPFNDFVKEIKAKTDAIGNAAKEIQDKLDEALIAKENHEAELARLEAEAKARRTEARKESLRLLGGMYDVDSGKFTFSYCPEVVADMQIMEYDDPTWENQHNVIKAEYKKEQDRLDNIKKQEEAEKLKALKEAEIANAQVLKLRKRLLEMSGFLFVESQQAFVKNTVALSVSDVVSFSEDDFDKALEDSDKQPEAEATPAEPVAQTSTLPPPPPSAPVSDPLGSVISQMTSQQEERVSELDGEVEVVLKFSKEKPFIDVKLNKTFIRIYNDSLESFALAGIPQNKIKLTTRTEDNQLTFQVIEF